MKMFLLILQLTFLNLFGSGQTKEIAGTYYSIKNEFERSSVMILKEDKTFIYRYALGGCQAEVTGAWRRENDLLKFRNDKEFLLDTVVADSLIEADKNALEMISARPVYPDLSKVDWIVKADYIKPLAPVDSGCLKEKGKHKKK